MRQPAISLHHRVALSTALALLVMLLVQPAGSGRALAQQDSQASSSSGSSAAAKKDAARNAAAKNEENAGDPQAEVEEEIYVTAEKRTEALEDIPASIAVMTEERLEEVNADDVADYMNFIPGLDVTVRAPGIAKTIIRGLSSESVTSTTGLYINESPVTQNELDPDLKLFDISRIEVLRGPQGTLYGEGSMGGTVRLITNQPASDAIGFNLDASGSTTDDGGENYDFDVLGNLPLVDDQLAVRVVVSAREKDAWIENLGAGDADNDEEAVMTRVAGRWTPSDRFQLDATYLHQDLKLGSPRYITESGLGKFERSTDVDESTDDEFSVSSVTWTLNLGFATLTSDTSYYERDQNTVGNNASTAGVQFFYNEIQGAARGFAPFSQFARPPGFPFVTVRESAVDFTGTAESLSEELRLVSNDGGRLQWIGGVFYKDKDDVKDTDFFGLINEPTVVDFEALDLLAGRTLIEFGFEQLSVFGEASYSFTDKLQGTAGLRYHSEDVDNLETLEGLFRYDFGTFPPTTTPVEFGPSNESFDAWTPRFILAYEASPQAMVYGSASRGFRSGGFVGLETFDPDTVWNYELGSKIGSPSRNVELSAAVYHIDWSDVQGFVDIDDPPFFAVFNVGQADIDGAELELTLRPATGLQVRLGGNLTDTEIVDVDPRGASAVTGLVEGNELEQVPGFTANAVTSYNWPITNRLAGVLAVNYAHVDSSFSGFDNRPSEETEPYDLVGLRFGIASERWEIYVYGKNVTNTYAEIEISDLDRPVPGIKRNQPRTLGLGFKTNL